MAWQRYLLEQKQARISDSKPVKQKRSIWKRIATKIKQIDKSHPRWFAYTLMSVLGLSLIMPETEMRVARIGLIDKVLEFGMVVGFLGLIMVAYKKWHGQRVVW